MSDVADTGLNTLQFNKDLYSALMEEDRPRVLSCCRSAPEGPLHRVTIHKDTVLHVACYSGQLGLACELLEMLPSGLNYQLGNCANDVKNTILHEAAMHDTMTDVARKILKRAPWLLTARSLVGETPVFRAVRYGNSKMFNLLAGKVEKYFDTEKDRRACLQRKDGTTILHMSIITEQFDVALKIANRYEYLITVRDDKKLTALQYLASNPSAFPSGNKSRRRKSFLYSLTKEKQQKYETTCQLAKKLIKFDTSWEATDYQAIDRGMPTKSLSTQEGGEDLLGSSIEIEEEEPSNPLQPRSRTTIPKLRRHDTPLLLATMSGIPEIVEEILTQYPQAIEHYNSQGRNILHVAVNYRQMKIFDMMVKMEMPAKRLLLATDTAGNSILHMVGEEGQSHVSKKYRSPAFQLQKELLLFERMKQYSKEHMMKVLNHKQKTADELFESKFSQLHKEAKEWLKCTAENCSIVAVLIATVAFAAAYTVPGGPNQSTGMPLLLSHPFFAVFTLADSISLIYSLTSVITFLSILTSPFQLQDFKQSLLLKLVMGFTCLILSVTALMVAFGATLVLMIRKTEKWTTFLLYSVSFLPVLIFVTSYLPMYGQLLKASTKGLKVRSRFSCGSLPSWITKLFKHKESRPKISSNPPQSPASINDISSSV